MPANRETAKTCAQIALPAATNTLLLARNSNRKSALLVNNGANPARVEFETAQGTNPTASAADGVLVAAGAGLEITEFSGAVAGFSTLGTDFGVIEL